ncbi:MAG TPA: glycosyltransferase family 4 protein [Symbiobacteriaceae bacterium]|jgi:spore coat protein SA|nr:glycosyltransferase family 4 protein [Symbiobacteriaceae bacterium]
MRICLVCTEKLPVPPVSGGAIQTYIAGVLPWLSRVHDVTVVCRTAPGLPDREAANGVRFVRVPAGAPGGGPAEVYAANVAAFLQGEPPFDRLVVYNRPAFVPRLAAAAGGAGLILSMHNDMFEPDRLAPAVARAVLAQVRAVVTISDHVRHTINRLHPGFDAKLRTIRSGVDTDQFRPPTPAEKVAVRRQLGLPSDDPVVLHVSRFSQRKGNLLLVEAMADVRQRSPGARLLVVGSSRYGSDELDPYGQAVHSRAQTLLGADGVRFTGFVPPHAVAPFFWAGDLFVCASQWEEPLARVHYEAMAAGLPIITTDRGGNAEVMEEGGNGLLVRPHDQPAAFANAIALLLAGPALRERMGRRGRELAVDRYQFRRVAEELLQVLGG